MTASRLLPSRLTQGWGCLVVALIAASILTIPARADDLPKVFDKGVPETLEDLKAIQAHVKEVLKKVAPAVVGLQIGPAQGSGVIINKEGHVLTAGHVSGEPGRPATVILPDGRRLKGKTLGANRSIDSGMVQIIFEGEKDKIELPFCEMAKSADLKTGHWAIAMGHPGGWQKGRSPVVRLGRVLDAKSTFIRTDCALVGGDSGGPLFDMHGLVIGINSRIGPTMLANVHVPVDTFRDTWDRLAKGEAWGSGIGGGAPAKAGDGYLGLRLSGDAKDCLVDEIVADSPAAKAGLKARDIITQVDSQLIASAAELTKLLATKRPGNELILKVVRGREIVTLRVTLGRRPS